MTESHTSDILLLSDGMRIKNDMYKRVNHRKRLAGGDLNDVRSNGFIH